MVKAASVGALLTLQQRADSQLPPSMRDYRVVVGRLLSVARRLCGYVTTYWMTQAMPQPRDDPAMQRWKRALGRFIETYGPLATEQSSDEQDQRRILHIQATLVILESLRQLETQAALLAREAQHEDWHTILGKRARGQGWSVHEAAEVTYGIRWCEILLRRQLDPVALLQRPPPSIRQWTRDVTA
jgi:hypothetical protein